MRTIDDMMPILSICHGQGSKMNFLVSDYIRVDTAYLIQGCRCWGGRGGRGPPNVSRNQYWPPIWPPQNFQGPLALAPPIIRTLLRPWVCLITLKIIFLHTPRQASKGQKNDFQSNQTKTFRIFNKSTI